MKQNKTSLAHKALSAALVLSLLGSPAMAGYSSHTHDGGRPTITVKSAQDEQVTFQVNVPNAEKLDIQIVIRDADGNALFREFVTKENYSKSFVINSAEAEKVKFEVFEGKKLIMENTYKLVKKLEETVNVSLEAGK
jgi:hypothetical protein